MLVPEPDDSDKLGQLARRWLPGARPRSSTSLDEPAIGFTFGLLRLPTGLVILPIGLQAFIAAQLGLRLGARVSERMREDLRTSAGVGLTGLGCVLSAEKLLA